jgi:hypothetical protein
MKLIGSGNKASSFPTEIKEEKFQSLKSIADLAFLLQAKSEEGDVKNAKKR